MREYYEHIKAKASLSMQDVIETCRSLTPSDYKTRPYRFPDLHNSVVRSFPSPPHMYHFVHLLFRPFFPIMEKHIVLPCFC